MTRNLCLVVFFSSLPLLFVSGVHASSCGTLGIELVSSVDAQGLMTSPAMYMGPINNGALAPGAWSITFDDTGWPQSGTSRRDHIKSLYTYDAQTQTFTATFLSNEVSFELSGSGGILVVGVASVTLVAVDRNGNGKLGTNELNDQTFTTTMDAACVTTVSTCGGTGQLIGGLSLDTILSPLIGDLDTELCATAVEDVLWQTVKVFYRE